MSNLQIPSKLERYKQVYPSGLNDLNNAYYGAKNINKAYLAEVGKNVKGFSKIERVSTEDYTWFWGMYFKFSNSDLAFLFPWCQDNSMANGTSLDRSIAVHVKGELDRKNLESTIYSLMKLLT